MSTESIATGDQTPTYGLTNQYLLEHIGTLEYSAVNDVRTGVTILTYAVMKDHYEAVLGIIGKGADPNAVSYVYDPNRTAWRREPPLVTASRLGHENIARILIDAGAMLSGSDHVFRMTAIHWACAGKHHGLAQLLVSRGANVNLINVNHETPIVEALVHKDKNLINLLLTNGADIQMSLNYEHDTCLLMALQVNLLDVAESFLDAGADPNKMNLDCSDALTLALQMPLEASQLEPFLHKLIICGVKVNAGHLALANAHKTHGALTLLQDAKYTPASLACISIRAVRNILRLKTTGKSILGLIQRLPGPSRLKQLINLSLF